MSYFKPCIFTALAGSDSEEAETEPTESHHPYAKVKKVREDHPYATVQQNVSENSIPNNGNSVQGQVSNIPRPAPEPLVDIRPQPVAPDLAGGNRGQQNQPHIDLWQRPDRGHLGSSHPKQRASRVR